MNPETILDFLFAIPGAYDAFEQTMRFFAEDFCKQMRKASRKERARARHARMCKGKHGLRRPR